jgi:hypothetical protein
MSEPKRYVLKFDLDKYYPNLKGDLEKLCKKYAEAGRGLSKACETAADSYARVFEAIAKSLPGWYADADGWKYDPGLAEKLTRDEAFKGLTKRRKKGKWK